jgi:histone deacetylase 6
MKLKFFTNLSFPANRVCYVYDEIMMQHKNNFEDHPEQPERIAKIKSRFMEYNLLERMKKLPSRETSDEELLFVHTREHVECMKEIENCENLYDAAQKFSSIYFHEKTFECAKYAAGSILQVIDEVLNNESQSGVCVVRPPGHHAETDEPNGFCIFNNVAIAAQYAIKNHGLERVLIVDWDVHHGNGIQHIFENDPKVLYMSIHRYDYGSFFPRSTDANYTEVGVGAGKGFNVNIPWNKKGMGDMEYVLTFQNIIMPIAYEFNPQLVLVSAGFDAAIGDQLGGCKVSPEAYGHFTNWLSALANGKIVLVLEGGYNVNSISHSMTMCTKALLKDPLPTIQLPSRWNGINASAMQTLKDVIKTQQEHWKCLKFNKKLPDFNVNDKKVKENDSLGENFSNMSLATSSNDSDDRDNNQSHQYSNVSAASSEDQCVPGTSKKADQKHCQTLTDFLNDNLQVVIHIIL